jgi:hypothetical protein
MTAEVSSISIPSDTWSPPSRPAKRGPKPKPIQDRVYRVKKPIKRKEETYPRARRLAVVMFLYRHQIYDPDHWKSVNGYRKPFLREASEYFKVPITTISGWYRKDQQDSSVTKRSYSPQWPQLEKQLFQDFIQLRLKQHAVSTAWFRKRAKDIFRSSVSSEEQAKLFTFSNGWWAGFRRRYNIVKRRVTNELLNNLKLIARYVGPFADSSSAYNTMNNCRH